MLWDVHVLWHWEVEHFNVFSPPVVGQLTDDNGDGTIDANDHADVVVSAFPAGV